MPTPRAMNRQFDRSVTVPCANLGYQARGTLIVRPSARSTTRASSETLTPWAKAVRISMTEELIPRPQESCLVCHDQPSELVQLRSAKTNTVCNSNRIQPEFGSVLVALDVHVRRFITIIRIEEE